MSDDVEQLATIDPPRAIRVRTSTGWADLAIQGPQGARGTDGAPGAQGPKGDTGATGAAGPGVPTGGAVGTILTKTSAADYASAWQAPAPQGADLVYNGDYPANTPYTDGDVVVYNGIAYLCVAPTSVAPTPWPGGPTVAPTPMPAYGTTLPVSPIDGQEAVLVDSITTPSYVWRFRYNARSTSAYKWEFVGGSALIVYIQASGLLLQGWNPSQPSLVVPRSGVYVPEAEALFTGQNGLIGIGVWTTAQLNVAHQSTSGSYWSLKSAKQAQTLSGGITLNQAVYTSTPNYATSTQDRSISLLPVRVA